MEEIAIPSSNEDLSNQVLAQFNAPAWVRRARNVEEAYDSLLAQCRAARDEWLPVVRLRLATAHDRAGDWTHLRAFFLDERELDQVRELHAELQPRLRLPVGPTTSRRALLRALRELCDSLERFNRRWQDHVAKLDLGPLNQLRVEYNCYYPLERECAFRSARVARHGFQPLAPLTTADVLAILPCLPVPRLVSK